MVIRAQERRWNELDGNAQRYSVGRIRAHRVSAEGSGDPWIAGKIKDDIEEIGYGGAPVRVKSDQELLTSRGQ